MRDYGIKFSDIPDNIVEEFMWRQPWSIYRMPDWVFRIPSERYRHRAKLRSLRHRVKLERK